MSEQSELQKLQQQRVGLLVDNLIKIFATEPPEFALQVLAIALGVVIGHCDPEAEEMMHHEFDSNVALMIQAVRGIKKNETH